MEVVGHFKEGRVILLMEIGIEAIVSFEKSLSANESDKLSSIYIDRCKTLKKTPLKIGMVSGSLIQNRR